MAIIWTKEWQGSDDGTVIGGIDLKNIQDDLANVQTVGDSLSIPGQTQGDILYFDGADWTRLAAGTAGQVLTTQGAGSNPTFDDAVATDLSVTSQATGDILYYDGANWVVIPPGTSGQVLTSNGAGVAPSYQTPSGGVSGLDTYTSDDTWVCPAGVTQILITMVGGGGGGGGGYSPGATATGGGGGAGSTIVNYPVTVTPSTGYILQVGLGGAGGAAASTGTTGEDTIFDTGGSPITAENGHGGGGGQPGPVYGPGGAGGEGDAIWGTDGADGTASAGGLGGRSSYGAGGVSGNPGGDGTGYGSGGGGCVGVDQPGGDGQDGLVIIMY